MAVFGVLEVIDSLGVAFSLDTLCFFISLLAFAGIFPYPIVILRTFFEILVVWWPNDCPVYPEKFTDILETSHHIPIVLGLGEE